MSLTVFFAVLAAALIHASWNAAIKTGANKQTSMLILTLGQGLLGFLVVIWRPLPAADVWPWLIASGFVHMVYQLFLAYAYEQGDLSRVYPISRGSAPLMVLIFSLFFLADDITGTELAGVFVLGLGIVLMARGAFTSGENRRLIPFALGAACATAAYTVIDGLGARIAGDPVSYVGWLLLLSGCFYLPVVLGLKGRRILRASRRDWARGMFAAAASLIAYGIAVWAMTQAPIALVAALRETSILFAVLIGWIVFGEKMNRGKAAAAALIMAGVALTRF